VDTGGVNVGNTLGVTPGGAKDIAYARTLIQMGGVPDGNTITVEGLMSEHDIPVDGAPCTSLLCLRPALGVATRLDTNQREHFVQLGFSSGFHRETFLRPPIDLVILVDHSSSMGIDMTETLAAVVSAIGKMRDDDRLAILTFNDSVQTLAPLGKVSDAAALTAQVQRTSASGGWNFMPALQTAFDVATAAGDDPTRLRRVMVFSCGYPGISSDPGDPVRALVHAGAAQRIGLSFFGVLLSWNPDLATLLGQERGGAYYYLQDLGKVEQVFDQNFDLMVTPILYNLSLAVDPGAAFEVVKLYGMPGQSSAGATGGGPPADPGSGTTGSAFLSSNHGAIVAELRAKAGAARDGTVGQVTLSYEPEPALGFGTAAVSDVVPIADPGNDDTEQYGSLGVRKSVALVNQATEMIAACNDYHGGQKAMAAARLTTLRDYLDGEATALAADDLRTEVTLVDKLLANLSP
jgi:Ca-activated chloride channel family protein